MDGENDVTNFEYARSVVCQIDIDYQTENLLM